MKKNNVSITIIILFFGFLAFASTCTKDDDPVPDPTHNSDTVQFPSSINRAYFEH